MVYKLGFRWRPVDFPVESTPLDTPPPFHFNPFRTRPYFDASPALNVIPTLLDQLPPVNDTAPPLPWGTAPVPPLQPLPPKPVYSRKTLSKDKVSTAETLGRTRSVTRATTTVTVSTKPTTTPTTTLVPAERPGPSQQPSRPQQPQPPRRPIARPQPIPLAPVTLQGVPGSNHRGTDLVSNILLINLCFVLICVF